MNEREISLVSEWNTFVNNENFSLIEKCLKLAQILEYPELSISKELEKIKEIGINFRNRITESKNPTYLISLLNEFLFDVEEFQGDLDDYYNPKNNFLNYDEFSVGVAEIPGVKAVTPQIEGQGLIVYNNNSSGIVVRGVRWSDLSARNQLWNSIGNKEIEFVEDENFLNRSIDCLCMSGGSLDP